MRPITELIDAHQVIADFVKKRGAHPIGNETIKALLPQLVAYALHSGRYRAATWHHEAAGIVWLLAEAERSRYGLFRQAEFGDIRIEPELLRTVLERLISIRQSVIRWSSAC